jgi:hypothetical protein
VKGEISCDIPKIETTKTIRITTYTEIGHPEVYIYV